MGSNVQLWCYDPYGELIRPDILCSEIAWSLEENTWSVLKATGPLNMLDPNWFRLDTRFSIMRSVNNSLPKVEGETQFLLRYWAFGEDSNGVGFWQMEAYSPEYWLDGRIVDYDASTAEVTNPYTTKTDQADDLLKAVARENIGPLATNAARRQPYLSIDADTAQGPSITKSFARRNVLDLAKEIAEASQAGGIPLTYGVVFDPSTNTFAFRTWKTLRGVDRRKGTGDEVIVSKRIGNLMQPTLHFDHRQERTVIRTGGKGEGAARAVGYAFDQKRIDASPFNFREKFIDSRQTDSVSQLITEAQAALNRYRPVRGFSGRLIDTNYARYGQRFGWGDWVTAEYMGYEFDCKVWNVNGSKKRDTDETIVIQLFAEVYE